MDAHIQHLSQRHLMNTDTQCKAVANGVRGNVFPVVPPPSEWPRCRWAFATPSPAIVQALMQAPLSLPRPLATAVASRGIASPAEAAAWLSPKLSTLVPPERLPGLPRAAERIRAAVRAREPIAVFGDFDADGICATTVLVTAIESIGGTVVPFIPDRATEGYGFTEAALTRLFREHPETRLVVTVDCGISQLPGCALCHARGIDVVLTDHHTPPETLPDVHAIVHPDLPGTPDPVRHLAGVGVAFKLAHALARGDNGTRLFDPAALLPLVALATVADMVPLTGENRVLVAAGLQFLNRGACPGLQALKEAAGIRQPLRAVDFGFKLGPRINASGRIGDPMDAYRLLRAASVREAQPLAQKLSDLNAERQSMEREATDAAFADLAWTLSPTARSVVATSEDWAPGVIGLVAGRLSQRLGLPAIAFRIDREKGVAKGSARCPEQDGLDLMDLLRACQSDILQFGGHSAAGGLSVALDHLDAFKASFEAACAAALPGPVHAPLRIEAWVDPALLSLEFHETMSRLEPTGMDNPAPVWALQNLELSCDPIPIGKEGQYRRFLFRREGDVPLEAVMFNGADIPMPWHAGDHVDLAVTTGINDFNGRSLQLLVEDIRSAQS